MDAIKKKMEKLSNETATAEARIAHFEDIKANIPFYIEFTLFLAHFEDIVAKTGFVCRKVLYILAFFEDIKPKKMLYIKFI